MAYDRLEPKQVLFYKMFFPLGVNFNWDSDSSLVKEKLCIVFERFKDWENSPQTYTQDLTDSKDTERTWKEWEEVDK